MDSLNGWFNSCVDIAFVVFARLSELPALLVLTALFTLVSVVFGVRYLSQRRRGGGAPLRPRYVRAVSVTLALGALAHVTQRLDLLLRRVRELEYTVRMDAVHRSRVASAAMGRTRLRLIDEPALERGLDDLFPGHEVETEALAPSVEFASIRTFGAHPTVSYATVVDLTDPRIDIHVTDELKGKELTSTFGAERKCVVAINGEAGVSPARDAPLASWRGELTARGKRISCEESSSRPFLCFDRVNRASYVAARSARVLPPESRFNAIWGRKDLLRDGLYAPDSGSRWIHPSPRTLMGIDSAGERLILIVVDGRQPGYSVGMSLETCASLMQLFGARQAMWCDQGGSSSMYLGCLAGLVNRPSDGAERPTYTHFGIGLAGIAEGSGKAGP